MSNPRPVLDLDISLVTATGGSRARTLADRFADTVNLLDYAVGDGSTDDTIGIKAAIDAARFKTLIVPGGHRFVANSRITCIGPMTVAGAAHGGGPGLVWEPGVPNQNVSEFICGPSFTSGDLFYCPSEHAVNFRDLLISSHVSLNFLNITNRGAGAAIHLVGANTTGSTNACSSIERVAFSGFDVDIDLERCADTRITQCYFQAWKTAAIDVRTGGFAVESSPGYISFNKFFGDVTPGTAQQQAIRTSSGYGAINNNVFVGSQIAIQVNVNDLVNIGSMIIAFNNIEEQLTYGIDIVQSGSATIDAITIQNNEFSNINNKGIASHINVTGASNAAIKTLSITGNKIQSFLAGGSGVCISVQTCTTGTISENLFAISGCYGISVGSVAGMFDVFDNKIDGTDILGTAGYFFSAPANVVVRDVSTRGVDADHIPNLGEGSSLYISNGRQSSDSGIVTSGGSGCIAWRTGGAWVTIPTLTTGVRVNGTGGPIWIAGAGVPVSSQPLGSLWSRTDGGVGTTLYVSRGGGTWAAVAGV